MSKIILAAIAAITAMSAQVVQAADVGVSIRIGQPGFYGQIDLGNMRQPPLIYAQPVLIERVAVRPAPVYLRVPPGHEKKWSKHCKRYNACGRPVYFVKGDWYEREYVTHYRDQYDPDQGRWRDDNRQGGDERGHGKDKGKDKDKGNDKGNDKHGKSHGKGHD